MDASRLPGAIRSLAVSVGVVMVGGVGLAISGVGSAAAQEKDDAQDLVVVMEPVKVEGQKIENVEDVRRELSRRPGSNILIEEKQITESRSLNLNDVLQFAPGVRFQSRFGADEGQFQIRGTSLRNNFHHRGINILINGIYFGDADGFSDFESIELLAYERIEVYKGANALRYGANTIGGAINFVPRTGYNASLLQIRAQAGSFGLVMGQVSSGKVTQPFKVGQMNATSDYYISVSGNHQDGFQDHSQQGRQRVNANLGLQLGEHQEMRAYFLQANVSESIPGSLTNAQLFQNPKQAGGQTPNPSNFFACQTNNQTCNFGRYYNLQRIGVAYRNEFSTNQFVEVIPYYQYQYIDHPIFQTIRQDNSNVGGEIRYRNATQAWGRKNSLVIGQQIRYGNQHQTRFVNINGSIGAMTQNAFLRSTYFGTYAEDQFDATEMLTLVIGGRWDYSGRQGNVQTFSPVGPPIQTAPSTLTNTQQPLVHFDAINPKIGFVYRTTPTSQLYFNASRAYEAPLNLELMSSVNADGSVNTGFLNLDAQRAWQFELGHRGTSADKRYTWHVTVYDLEMQKELLASNINNQSTFQNANGTRHTGVEAGGAMVLTKGLVAKGGGTKDDSLQTRVAYTWSRFKFTDDVRGGGAVGPNVLIAQDGNTVAGAPEHNLNMELRYDHPSGFWIAPNFEWSLSGFYTDYLNTVKNPCYFVLHLKSGWNIAKNKNLTLYAEGRNLTDKTYAGAVVVNDQFNRFANPGQGISGFAGVEWRY
jgi:iron complex outermembrane receptor protein